MNIYFNNPDKTRLHSFYGELLANPPVNYVNLNDYKNRGESLNTKKSIIFQLGRLVLKTLRFPAISIVKTNADLIHSGGSIPISKTPYVIDFEHIMGLAGFDYNKFNSKLFRYTTRKFLESDRCKKIMPWSEAAKKGLFNTFDSEIIRNKTEVVYPAISLKKRKKHKKFTALFVAHNTKKKGVDLLPEGVKIVSNVSREKVLEEFSKADVLVYPSIVDTFGMVLIEAMSFGLPIIAVDDFCSREIVGRTKCGFLIDGVKHKWFNKKYLYNEGGNNWINVHKWNSFNKIKSELIFWLDDLKNNKTLRDLMGNNARRIIKSGKFSIKHRNKTLRRIYNAGTNNTS